MEDLEDVEDRFNFDDEVIFFYKWKFEEIMLEFNYFFLKNFRLRKINKNVFKLVIYGR